MTNWGNTLFQSLSNTLNLVLTFIPRIIGFLVIVLIGWIVGTIVSKVLTMVLRKVGFDRFVERTGLRSFEQNMGVHMDPANLLGKVVYWFIFLIFLIPAIDALGLPTISGILNSIITYIPNVFVAILVLFLGLLAANVVSDLVRGATASAHIGNPNVFAMIARWAIIGFAALVALEQLQIAPALINELFGAIVAASALAFGLAFGLGGQDTARRWLARGENSVGNSASHAETQPTLPQSGVADGNSQRQPDQMRTSSRATNR